MSPSALLPGNIISLTADAADRLLRDRNGDAALLYLHLLRTGGVYAPQGARKVLGWAEERTAAAHQALMALGLVEKAAAVPESTPPEPDEPPAYSAADLARELERAGPFPHLVDEVQRLLGKVLTTTDLQMLFTLYDYLALPAEVVLLLTAWCLEECERKYGSGRKPRLSQIRREGFIWRRLGVDTIEAADAHVRTLSALRGRERALLPLLGISGRQLVEGERKYVDAWVGMGFDDEAIRLAYEKTVLKKQNLNWAYMNSILKSWHQKGLHTLDEVERGDTTHRRRPDAAPASPEHAQKELRKELDWMDRFLEETDQKKGGA